MARSTALLRSLAIVSAVGAFGMGVAACGSDTPADTASSAATTATTGTSTTSTATAPAAATTVAVTLGKPDTYSLVTSPTSATAGKVTFTVDNAGDMVHELVVLKTDTPAKDLPVKDGAAVETGNIGETGDMPAGTKKNLTVTMEKGHYVLLCNLPGHYQGGMYRDFTVS